MKKILLLEWSNEKNIINYIIETLNSRFPALKITVLDENSIHNEMKKVN